MDMARNKPNLDPHNKRNSLGMTKQVYKSLLKKLDAPHIQRPTTPIKRAFTRLEYLDPYFELTLEKTAHARQRKITVASRNISRCGMSVLHSSYVYPGTAISANLRKTDDEHHLITGKVCRCEHRGGVVHEIGVQFDQEINIHEFITPDLNEGVCSLETVDPAQLKGKVLFVGSDPLIMPFVREYLIETNLNFGIVDTAKEALEKDRDEYDLVFVSLDAGGMTGSEFIRVLRDKHFKKPLILSGKADTDQVKQQIRLSTADMFLPAPITETSLLCAIGEFLLTQWSEGLLASVRNSGDVQTTDQLNNKLASLAITLDAQIQIENSVEVYITCTKIKNISTLLGLKSLHTLTSKMCEEIAQTGDISKFQTELASIHLICKSANKAA